VAFTINKGCFFEDENKVDRIIPIGYHATENYFSIPLFSTCTISIFRYFYKKRLHKILYSLLKLLF